MGMFHSSPNSLLLLLLLLVATPSSFGAQSDLAESLREDVALQDAAIIAVRSALGARPQTAVVRRNTFVAEVSMYIETYRMTRNTITLENIQKRYAAAKGELLEPRLPESMEELVSILELL